MKFGPIRDKITRFYLSTPVGLVEFPSLPLRWSWVFVAVGGWSRLQKGEGDQDRIRPESRLELELESSSRVVRTGYDQGQGSRLELESSSRGVRTGYDKGQGWSWSRLLGVSGQDAVRVKAGAGLVF
ncbi:hypothetical protein RRG08_056693 [Elysia crispata]|uniref:Uncharacterized protein n=1 Tax=Elysia crispata TaxID=231223 RepID=A0AAE1CSN7_9GAST|nr:hypothetical protein RRG08_056693 [Elysia crispata]